MMKSSPCRNGSKRSATTPICKRCMTRSVICSTLPARGPGIICSSRALPRHRSSSMTFGREEPRDWLDWRARINEGRTPLIASRERDGRSRRSCTDPRKSARGRADSGPRGHRRATRGEHHHGVPRLFDRAYGYIKIYLLGDALASRRRPTTAPPCGHAGLDGGH